jgi:hypothetical protein
MVAGIFQVTAGHQIALVFGVENRQGREMPEVLRG